jgi:hypothetical protein
VCRSIALSADSRLAATIVNGRNAAQVWDLTTGRAMSDPLPHPGDHFGLFSVGFSPDGRYLLTGHRDGQVRCWDWQAGRLACPPLPHGEEVFDVVITPDGRHAVTTLRGQALMQVWELTTGRRLAPPIHLGFLGDRSSHTLAITPDGRRALVGVPQSELAVVDLEALLAPAPMPAADLACRAELATAQRIEDSDLSGLTRDQWQERWNLLHERSPHPVRAGVTETRSLAVISSPIAQAAVGAYDRGNELARRGQWAQAAKEALAEVTANPDDRRCWADAAPRLILAGDLAGYRRLCRRMVEQFRETSSVEEADSTCKVCLLLPGSVDRSVLPSRVLIDGVEQGTARADYSGWFYACMALFAYRDGTFELAAGYSAKSREINRRRNQDSTLALLVLAMAQQQLQKTDEARKALAEATALIAPELATLGTAEFQGTLPVSLDIVAANWLMAEIIRREASSLILGKAER